MLATGPEQETPLPAIAPAFTTCPGALSIEAAWMEAPTSATRACSPAGVPSPRRVASDPPEAGAGPGPARIGTQGALTTRPTRHCQWIISSLQQPLRGDTAR